MNPVDSKNMSSSKQSFCYVHSMIPGAVLKALTRIEKNQEKLDKKMERMEDALKKLEGTFNQQVFQVNKDNSKN